MWAIQFWYLMQKNGRRFDCHDRASLTGAEFSVEIATESGALLVVPSLTINCTV